MSKFKNQEYTKCQKIKQDDKNNKSSYNISNRTTRYLQRTIKKNNLEILNANKYIKLLNESLRYMTDYAISSYDYNNYLVNYIDASYEENKCKNDCNTEYNP